MLNGIIVINKEAGFTSHDVVAKMRGICKMKKIGHTGTLDPDATGVLPVCLGSGTRLCDMLTDMDKEYVAELLLGVETDTQDMSGSILAEYDVNVDESQVTEAVMSFVGEYDQIPPMYSAIKVNGRKLYELAREGKEIERKPRRVSISAIEIMDMQLPLVKIRVSCAKGTYIRALCADIGEKLGCRAAMKSLVRTRVGEYELGGAVTLTELEKLRDENRLETVLYKVDSPFGAYPALHISTQFVKLIDNGNSFFPNQTRENIIHDEGLWVRVYREDESFAGIYTFDDKRKWYRPVKMFL